MTKTTKTIVLISGLAFGAQASAQVSAPSAQDASGTVPSGSVTGMAALRMIEDRLETFAAEYHLSPVEMASMLRNDRSMYLTPEGRLVALCPKAPDHIQNDTDGSGGENLLRGGVDIPLDDFLNLESNPGASKTIYLDFDGHHSQNNSWGHNIVFPAYNTAGGTGVFTDQEKSDIINHWREVVEDFAPYNVNVTTRDPGTAALIKSNTSDQIFGIRCVMTQPTDTFGDGIGGVAFLNSFNDNVDNPCFGFNKGLGAGPMTASHEVGHTLGLSHDGLSGQTYHPGSSRGAPSWGPIMGAPFGRLLVQWSNGDYPGSSTTQNDVNIILGSSNGITAFADDFGSDPAAAASFDISSQATGVLNSRTDVDARSFVVPAGEVIIEVKNIDNGPNTDLKFDLYRTNPLQLIESVSPIGTADASGTWNLQAGTYAVVIDGTFEALSNGAVSDYGSFGQYTIDVTFIPPPTPVTISFPNGLPAQLQQGVPTDITVSIDPGSFALDTGNLTMLYGRNVTIPPFSLQLVPQGGNLYTGTLPAGECNDAFIFSFEIGVIGGSVVTAPENPFEFFGASVVCDEPPCPADTNGDGDLTPADFSAWIAAFNAQSPACDQNGDTLCTPADFSAWIAGFNAGC